MSATEHATLPTTDREPAAGGVSRRVIERVGPLRTVVKSGTGQRLIQTIRGAGVVTESARFGALELGSRRTARYHLRGSQLQVTLRHGTRDVAILNEILGATGGAASSYEPPEEVARVLDALPAPRILDLGANIGLFGLYALTRWPAATIACYEPDPSNAELLEATIAANGAGQRWSATRAAVSNADGVMCFLSGRFSESRMATAEEPGTIDVPTVDLFALDHDVDLLKMDIEGGEWAILCDPRLPTLRADAIVLESHTLGAPGPDARAEAAALLSQAGYVNSRQLADAGPAGVIWAWR